MFMNMLLTFMIVCLGFSVYAWAEELPAKTEAVVVMGPEVEPVPVAPVVQDDCKDLLPQAEKDYQELGDKYQQIKSGQQGSYESYTGSFSEMTDVLFQLTEAKEQETAKISESRDLLKNTVTQFNQDRSTENSKHLQDQYMDLTVRLYSSVMDGQKILDTLKSQLSKVEATRSQFETSKVELEKIDHQRLALEAKLITLKIRCQSDQR